MSQRTDKILERYRSAQSLDAASRARLMAAIQERIAHGAPAAAGGRRDGTPPGPEAPRDRQGDGDPLPKIVLGLALAAGPAAWLARGMWAHGPSETDAKGMATAMVRAAAAVAPTSRTDSTLAPTVGIRDPDRDRLGARARDRAGVHAPAFGLGAAGHGRLHEGARRIRVARSDGGAGALGARARAMDRRQSPPGPARSGETRPRLRPRLRLRLRLRARRARAYACAALAPARAPASPAPATAPSPCGSAFVREARDERRR